ncbi:MAG: DUF3293 domain-containing protein [Rhodospirillales bacterium]
MPETTQIHPDKVRAYLATDYVIDAATGPIVLTIGKRSEHLIALFSSNSVECGAFLTGYNPHGNLQSDAANALAHAELAQKLSGQGFTAIEGSGSEAGTDWPAERSWFALGMPLTSAKEIGTHFHQDAIVWVGSDAVPRLILLR